MDTITTWFCIYLCFIKLLLVIFVIHILIGNLKKIVEWLWLNTFKVLKQNIKLSVRSTKENLIKHRMHERTKVHITIQFQVKNWKVDIAEKARKSPRMERWNNLLLSQLLQSTCCFVLPIAIVIYISWHEGQIKRRNKFYASEILKLIV